MSEDQMMDWKKVTVTNPDGGSYSVENAPKGHPNASILMEIAKEAAINGETVEVNIGNGWLDAKIKAVSDSYFIVEYDQQETPILQSSINIRRKPRTIRIGNYDVPEPKAFGQLHSGFHKVQVEFESAEQAEVMVKALQELLGAKQ